MEDLFVNHDHPCLECLSFDLCAGKPLVEEVLDDFERGRVECLKQFALNAVGSRWLVPFGFGKSVLNFLYGDLFRVVLRRVLFEEGIRDIGRFWDV